MQNRRMQQAAAAGLALTLHDDPDDEDGTRVQSCLEKALRGVKVRVRVWGGRGVGEWEGEGWGSGLVDGGRN